MFRRTLRGLPEDSQCPCDLASLGYQLSDKNTIISSTPPHGLVKHRFNDNERHNQLRAEAVQMWSRGFVLDQFATRQIFPLFLPQLSICPPPHDVPTVPILTTALSSIPESTLPLKKRSQIVVIINQTTEDLGVLSYRTMFGEAGLQKGSLIALTDEILSQTWVNDDAASMSLTQSECDKPGLIIANPGQTLFAFRSSQDSKSHSVTNRSWLALPRSSGLHNPLKVHCKYNRIEHNETAEEHVRFVLSDAVLGNPELVSPDAHLFFIAIGDSNNILLASLGTRMDRLGPRIKGLALVAPSLFQEEIGNPLIGPSTLSTLCTEDLLAYKDMLKTRAKSWCIGEDIHRPLTVANKDAANTSEPAWADDVKADELGALPAKAHTLQPSESTQDHTYFHKQVAGGAYTPEDIVMVARSSIVAWLSGLKLKGDK